NLKQTIFTNIDLSGCKFENVNLSNASITNANLTGMTVNGVSLYAMLRAYEERAAKDQQPTDL
ncbi:MAG: pentapeptide repeat-containing protein, partial [Gemmatimonadaceae bacterium]